MAIGKCITGNVVKQNASTVIQGGRVSDTTHTNSLTLRGLTANNRTVGTSVTLAVSPASSGNLGTAKPYAAGTFSSFVKNEYVGKVIGKKISGVANTLLVSGANLITQKPINSIKTTHTSFLTALAWSSNRDGGPTYTATKSDQTPDFGVDKEVTTLGQFVYLSGKPVPVQADYPGKYSN